LTTSVDQAEHARRDGSWPPDSSRCAVAFSRLLHHTTPRGFPLTMRCHEVDENSLPTIYHAITFQSAARDQVHSRARNEQYNQRNALSSVSSPTLDRPGSSQTPSRMLTRRQTGEPFPRGRILPNASRRVNPAR